MAAVADVQLVNISINDVELQVPKGELIVESVKRLGLEVPIFCYHPRMKPVGMCRMCLIEIGFKQPDGSVRKMPKPQTACTLPASEGLIVYTDTQLLHTDRRGVLEFLLINHPLDCPICDRGGECPLQNNTLFYGPSTSRFVEIKRHAPKAFPLSQYVTLDLERCIQCGRCVRFTEEISGDAQLALRFRGARTQPGTFELRNFESKFSGNVIEICPVGALTSSKYRFRARPWDLQTRPGICTVCSNGCNVYVDYRVDEIARINGRTNEAVNEEWTCDRGKFGHYPLNSDKRLKSILVRDGASLVPSDWSTAYEQLLSAFQGGNVAALAGTRNSNEDLYTLRNLFRDVFGSDNLDYRFERHLVGKPSVDTVQNSLADFETVPSILVFGTSLADEEPILYLRVRKAWFKNGVRVVVAHDGPTDVDSFADVILRYRPGTAAALAAGLQALTGGDAAVTFEQVEAATGVPVAHLREAAELIKGSAIITTRGLYDVDGGAEAVESLGALAKSTGGTFSNYARGANEEGASLLGIVPENGLNTHEILQAAASGKLRALWLAGVDPFDAHPDRALVQRALENVDFLVFQHHTESEALHYASVVLPMTAPTEAEGSYTNLERRVQRFGQVLPPKGDAKPAWRVFTELSLRTRPQAPPFNPGEILARIADEVPEFAGVTYAKLAGEGFLLGVGPDPHPQDNTQPVEVQG
jgi:NADH-quinone oxidoreductase subunit G